jgi:hypothetical protein
MNDEVIVVLADGDEAQIRMLRTKLAGTKIVAGNTSEAFAQVAADATVLCNFVGAPVLFQKVFAMRNCDGRSRGQWDWRELCSRN